MYPHLQPLLVASCALSLAVVEHFSLLVRGGGGLHLASADLVAAAEEESGAAMQVGARVGRAWGVLVCPCWRGLWIADCG